MISKMKSKIKPYVIYVKGIVGLICWDSILDSELTRRENLAWKEKTSKAYK